MEQWIQSLMNYPGIVFLMALENLFPPIPSELIMPLAGFEASKNGLNIVAVIICGVIGSLIGQTVLYFVGSKIGEERLTSWADKHGEWLALSGDDIKKGREWFDKHGNKAALIGRVVPGIRSLVSIPAGIVKMPLPKFLLYSGIGTTIWTTALALLGLFLGEKFDGVEKYVGIISKVVIGGMLAYFIFQVIKRKQEKKSGNGKKEEDKPKTSPAPRQAL